MQDLKSERDLVSLPKSSQKWEFQNRQYSARSILVWRKRCTECGEQILLCFLHVFCNDKQRAFTTWGDSMVSTQGTEGRITASSPVGKHSIAENRIRGKCHLKRDSSAWALGFSFRHTPSLQPCLNTGQGHRSSALAFTQPQLGTVTATPTTTLTGRICLSYWATAIGCVREKKQPLLCVDQQGDWEGCETRLAWATSNKFRRLRGWVRTPWSLIQTGHEVGK